MKGILVVHFGSTYDSAREKALDPITELIKNSFLSNHNISKESDLFVFEEAYSSNRIIKKLSERNIAKNSIESSVRKLVESGAEDIDVITSFVIDGIEFEKLKRIMESLSKELKFKYKVRPALMHDNESVNQLARIISELIKRDCKEEAVLLCGHGTESKADERYESLRNDIEKILGIKVINANMEGTNHYSSAMEILDKNNIKSVYVQPMMIVYGDHGFKDIEGDEDSLKVLLMEKTIKYKIASKGLGEYKEIRELFMEEKNSYIKKPMEIENRSMEIIREELKNRNLSFEESEFPIISRIIHTTGDLEYINYITMSKGFMDTVKDELVNGCKIYCDTNMIVSGINKAACKKFNVEVLSYVSDENTFIVSKEKEITRSMAAIDRAVDEGITCFAFGNAPTALYRLLEHVKANRVKPKFIIGVPVGFVGASESKEYLSNFGIEQIRINGTRGGSNIAVSIVNALLYEAGGR